MMVIIKLSHQVSITINIRQQLIKIHQLQVDIFITVKGQKELIASEVTDTNGRVVYNIPDGRRLPIGLYSIQMVVRLSFIGCPCYDDFEF